jgi:RHS repeat-associated protein
MRYFSVHSTTRHKANVKPVNYRFFVLFFAVFVVGITAQAQTSKYPLVRTPAVFVNTTLPKNALRQGEAPTADFSLNPTDAEIFGAHFLPEPLVPAKGAYSAQESTALVLALTSFRQRTNADDFSAITNFLSSFPKSRWRGAVLANMGLIYRKMGYYNKAMDVWGQSWMLLKNEKDLKVKRLADKVIAELLMINSWVGRVNVMDSIMQDIKTRVINGPAVQLISVMKKAIWLMKNRPGVSFKCGPYALNKLYVLKDSTKPYCQKLMDAQSTPSGFSLAELEKLSNDIGLNYQAAFRKPGAPVIVNSVIHWKLGHYSVLLKSERGHYLCEDATIGTYYGPKFALTQAALDSSASGYFLVPKGVLPPGWRNVTQSEASAVFGKGQEVPDPGKHVSDDDLRTNKCKAHGMAQASVHLTAVSLNISDVPLFYQPPVGPAVDWTISYHQKDGYSGANLNYSNFGPNWSCAWFSSIVTNLLTHIYYVDVFLPDGGVRTFVDPYNDSTTSDPEIQTGDILHASCPTCYELRHPDGSKNEYQVSDLFVLGPDDNYNVFLTQVVDRFGNAITISYDKNFRIVALTDAIGQVTTLSYGLSTDIYKITKVTDPFGRSASFQYDSLGRLVSITDMIGMTSQFQYDNNTPTFINQMTTPYGTTKFVYTEGEGAYSLETDYPLGEKERVEYREGIQITPGLDSLPPAGITVNNQFLEFRNTFYWDKKAMKEGADDYSKAVIYHWLHGNPTTNETGVAAPILESLKMPLESRLWFLYQNQPAPNLANEGMSAKPAIIARVLDDSTTQIRSFGLNVISADTAATDPLGRTTKFLYAANHIDMLQAQQVAGSTTQTLVKYSYNSQHLPLTITDASGQKTTITYNAAGQPLTINSPQNETTVFTYDAKGYLLNVKRPAGDSLKFTYDGFGRVRTTTDAFGYTITIDYDALNRPTVLTYPDGSFEQKVYSRLDVLHYRDRLGRWMHYLYDSLDRLSATEDALARITQYIWCSCGNIAEIIDPLKHITSFARDLEGRVTTKTYNDGKTVTYQYENTTNRLKSTTDAKGQVTAYAYFGDDNLEQVTYSNAVIPTPAVSFTYDPLYNRVVTMTDGTGTTTYAYNPVKNMLGAGMLASVDGPLNNDVVTYSYDSSGRVIKRAINGVAATWQYDAGGRLVSEGNILGNFTYSFTDNTSRLSGITFPNGQSTQFDYFDNTGDNRLKDILNKTTGNVTLSRFDYTYNAVGQITKWTQQTNNNTPQYYTLGYDKSDQLSYATLATQGTDAIVKRYAYQYDKAGNRASEQADNTVTSALYNGVNQLTLQQDGGLMLFKGTLSKFSSVSLKNNTTGDTATATVDTSNIFTGFVKVSGGGNNNIAVTAVDYSGNNNTQTNNYNIAVGHGVNNTVTFDDNGNITTESNPAVQYGWDAADRLVKLTQGANVTEFVYDGLGRRVAEKLNGTIIKTWLWCDKELCEERDASGGNVTKRFFARGEQVGSTKYYFTRDHLGSVREVIDAAGNIAAQYSYDPYGRQVKVSGSLDADFGFTGFYYHKASGLYLAFYRAYNPTIACWLNRDPIQERGGLNLYEYCSNNPIHNVDRLGQFDNCNYFAGYFALAGVGYTALAYYGVAVVVSAPAAFVFGALSALTWMYCAWKTPDPYQPSKCPAQPASPVTPSPPVPPSGKPPAPPPDVYYI